MRRLLALTACNDANPCSLETARDKVRAAIAGGMDRDIEVRLTGGVSRMAEPLVLDGRDWGPGGHTVTWTAAPGAEPVLSGGVPITGWRQEGTTGDVEVIVATAADARYVRVQRTGTGRIGLAGVSVHP